MEGFWGERKISKCIVQNLNSTIATGDPNDIP